MSVTVTAPSIRNLSNGEKRALAYVEWRLACIAVWATYREWTSAMRADGVLAYAAYDAALDHEHAAATAYARLMKHACGPTRGPGHSRSAEDADHVSPEEGRC